MAKTNPSVNPLDDAMSFVAQRSVPKPIEAAAQPVAPAEVPAASSEPPAQPAATIEQPAGEQPADNQQQKGKKDPAPSTGSGDYAGRFLKTVRGRKAKTIYLSEEMHTALATITQASPDNIGLSDLLINIITHHFETFGPEIRQFLTAQEKLRKNKLPY